MSDASDADGPTPYVSKPAIRVEGSASSVNREEHAALLDLSHSSSPASTVPILNRALLTTVPLFMGYAGMITLQHHVKVRIGISDDDKDASDVFSSGVGCLYLGNLCFRLLHNVLLAFLKPKYRVVFAYSSMALAHIILTLAYYVFESKHVAFVYLAYLIAGIAIGTFESNLISCLTPLGHGTKSRAVVGIPIGFNGVSVGFFIVFAAVPGNLWLEGGAYVLIAVCNLAALFFFLWAIPQVDFEASKDNFKTLISHAREWRGWLPNIWRHCVALLGDMFMVSMFSAVCLYIFDVPNVPLWPTSTTTVPKNYFQAFYNLCAFAGDFSSRQIAYRSRELNPLLFLIVSIIGGAIAICKVAIIAPVGMFLVMFANGSIYAQTTRHVDNHVGRTYNLIGLSMWLFVGDIGSYTASNVVAPVRSLVGGVVGGAPPPSGPNSSSVNATAWQLLLM